MGYQPKRRTFRLRFEDDNYDGLVVRTRSIALGELQRLSKLSMNNPEGLDPLFEAFADALIEWNLEDPDTAKAVPATLEGIQSQDADFIMPILKAWMEAIAGVPGPLGQRSSDGARSEVPPIPMEAR